MVKKLSTDGITITETGTVTFEGPDAVAIYRETTLQSAAALYINAGIKVNRAYTPTRMRDALNTSSGSKAKNLKRALHDHVIWFEAATGKPVNNPQVLEAIGEGA